MRRVDPTIKLIAVGDNDMRWNRTVLERAGNHIDYLAIHHYYNTQGEVGDDPYNLMARPLYFERFYKEVAELIRETAPGRQIKLAINEWGLALPVHRQYSIESALYAGRLMNVFERSGDVVGMSAVSDLVNGWPGGIIQANRHGLFLSPIYLVNQLYATHLGAERLAVEVKGPSFDTTREGKQVPFLDTAVTRSADGRRIFIKSINTDRVRALDVNFRINGGPGVRRAEIEMISADSPGVFNSFATPNAVSIKRARITAGRDFHLILPKHSISVITLHE
jgi:alpha-N-arabinofuranosidase